MAIDLGNFDPVDHLNAKEHAFVENIAMGLNPSRAAANAGYGSVRSKGPALMRNDRVRDAIHTRRAELRDSFRIKREDVLIGLRDAIKDAKLLSEPMSQIAGWREIGRMLGYYEPERKIIELSDHTPTAIQQLQEVSTTELLELAGPSGSTIDGEFTLLEAPRAH